MSTVTESIGRVLAGRYRIESVLGTGASAHVFAARDVSLRRRVAIKLLHPALTSDGAFLRRFRAEARAAAALTHPHILAVFDWGEDTSGPFLVLEFLGGGSLRELLDDGSRLSVSQAVAVGNQAAEGLAYAHSRGFVHRDVKPANLLFDEEARLRIADFGLARALAEAAWTEPAGATVGTARYAAPEQALGNVVDGRADVYALALVLYEAVSGVVPFTADTTISTLMARVGARLPGHDSLGVLAEVLNDAAAPDPEERLDAASFARKLGELSSSLPPPQPLPVRTSTRSRMWSESGPGTGADVGPGVAGAETPERAADREWATGFADVESDALGGATFDLDRTEHGMLVFDAESPDTSEVMDMASAVGVASGADELAARQRAGARGGRPAEAHAGRTGSRSRRLPWKVILIALVVAVLLGGGAFGLVQSKVFVPSHRLPDLLNLTPSQATARLKTDHLDLKVVGRTYSTTVASGGIVREAPAAGTSLKEGNTVSVWVSTGPPPVAVPSLASITAGGCSAVASALASAHLHPDCLFEHSMQVQAGGVIDWSPKSTAPEFSAVKVYISQGPPIEQVPSLNGLTCAAATSTLEAIGLHANCQSTYTTGGTPVGQVIPNGWSPSTSAPEGSTVNVQISNGPPLVQVPQLSSGETLSQVIAAIQGAGLVVGNIFGSGNTIFATNPSYPQQVPQGTSVDIYRR